MHGMMEESVLLCAVAPAGYCAAAQFVVFNRIKFELAITTQYLPVGTTPYSSCN
jgi:hypothetical protein